MPLWALLAAGFLIRLLFIGSNGFHNDVAAFESWAITLRDNAPWTFYTKSTFADYPPGYFIVLWIIGHFYALIPGSSSDPSNGYALLRALVKMPAILMDLVNAGMLFAIVRRYASHTVALIAAAFLALNPAAIYVSAYWGQVDSVSWGLVLLTLYLVLRAGDDVAKTASRLSLAWVVFTFSLLIKPQAATFGALLLVYPFATLDAAVRRVRLIGTAGGIVGALVLTWLVTILFHGSVNPVEDLSWLLQRYEFGSSVYKYTSVNAFNLYAIKYPFWQPDTLPLHIFGFPVGPLSIWGVVLVLASTILIAGRYLQRRDDRSLIEGALLLALAFFCLATRMHERYIYGAFLLATPLIAFGTAGLWSSVVLTVTMYMNLAYSLYYQTVMENHTTGVDATNLWPYLSNLASLANVLVFFILGYLYLGGTTPAVAASTAAAGRGGTGVKSLGATFGGNETAAVLRAMAARTRAWFSPIEGLAAMTRVDHLLAWGLGVLSFVQCIIFVWYPAERYFDEVYYPRAGEEYIKHLDVSGWGPFEFTHPPFTKLLITASMLLNGGLTHDPHGSSFGWRFLNVVVGALTIPLLYAFAKRLTSSTLFATIAGGMLLFDGFHYVQSRISTPEITVAFWSLATVYAFYRLWIASGIRRIRIPAESVAWLAGGITMGIGAIVAIALYLLVPDDHIFGPHPHSGGQYVGAAQSIMLLYVLMVFWLITRLIVLPWVARAWPGVTETSYADGTRIIEPARGDAYAIVNQTEVPLGRGTQGKQKNTPAIGRSLAEDGTMTYATADGGVGVYAPSGIATFSDGKPALKATDARVWWVLLAFSAAFLADSKWNGLLDFLVVWMFAGLIWLQRYIRRDALWGNPFGMPLDIIVTGMLVVAGFVYTLSYIPFFIPFTTGAHGYVDMIAMQQDMYHYHSTLVATHPYASKWWQWPLILKPISYYWHDFRTNQADAAACCVAEILALPNPFIWWFGALTVPIVGWLAWSERNKGYALLFAAYLWHWLPWARSPRLEFEYHFYPNLAMIVLCNAIVLQRIWHWRADEPGFTPYLTWPRVGVLAYCLIVVAAFFFFLPVLSAWPMKWDAWHARMWLNHWVI
jgi:Gpi18-like mannosyltransferase/predicted membrane-bound dolichyl-phosphate-mannose-protein mannosyltransferase